MKKALSLLLALTLIFAMAAPASAAEYYGRYSRDETYNNYAYVLTAVCGTNTAQASISYADSSARLQVSLKVYRANGTSDAPVVNTGYTTAAANSGGSNINRIYTTFKIGSTTVGSATVYPE